MKKIICLLLCLATLSTCVACSPTCENFKNEELVLTVKRENAFKMAQFADLHFGQEGAPYHNADEGRTIAFMDYLVETEKPDFIVLSGDNIMTTGVSGAQKLIEIMDKYKTPYTFVFGNHDAESYEAEYSKRAVSEYLESSRSPYLLYKSGYIEDTSENRYGNFSISLKDENTGDLLGALIIVDTGVYDYSLAKYQSITPGQISWYKSEINRLDKIYSCQRNNKHEVVPTITYGHIQLPEHLSAYQKALDSNGAEFVYYQELGGWMQNQILSDAGEESSSFYSAMKEMKSAKAYLCGHMHALTYHVKMEGIVLGFCPQMCVTAKGGEKFSTFLYSFDENFDFDLKLVNEP